MFWSLIIFPHSYDRYHRGISSGMWYHSHTIAQMLKPILQSRPAAYTGPDPFVSDYHVTNAPSFTAAISALSSLVFAFAGTPAFFAIVSEMRDPTLYTRSMLTCQGVVAGAYITIGTKSSAAFLLALIDKLLTWVGFPCTNLLIGCRRCGLLLLWLIRRVACLGFSRCLAEKNWLRLCTSWSHSHNSSLYTSSRKVYFCATTSGHLPPHREHFQALVRLDR